MQIRVLGCSGSIAAGSRTTSFLLDDDILIDAGSGVGELRLDELARIDALNNDPTVHGILVQMPLPKHIDAQKVIEAMKRAYGGTEAGALGDAINQALLGGLL